MPIIILAGLFLLVAVVYASVGFGGGSTYSALLVLSGTEFQAIPAISLSCNILVVSGGVLHFHRAGVRTFKALLPFVVLSVPMAWVGGQMRITESTFVGLLGFVLLIVGLQMIWTSLRVPGRWQMRKMNPWLPGVPLGGAIGFLSGMVGIGGGIFLAPLLYFTSRVKPRKISAMASGFILVNSIAGLSGQLMKQGDWSPGSAWLSYWPLFLAVLIGGQIGSRIGARVLPEPWIKRLTGLLVVYVGAKLLLRWVEIAGSAISIF